MAPAEHNGLRPRWGRAKGTFYRGPSFPPEPGRPSARSEAAEISSGTDAGKLEGELLEAGELEGELLEAAGELLELRLVEGATGLELEIFAGELLELVTRQPNVYATPRGDL